MSLGGMPAPAVPRPPSREGILMYYPAGLYVNTIETRYAGSLVYLLESPQT